MTWPVLRHPATRLPADLAASAADATRLARAGHALARDPVSFFRDAVLDPGSAPEKFGADLLGLAPLATIGNGGDTATLRYNLLFVMAFALAAVGMYALVRQLGAGRLGATVAAAAFAFAPVRLGQAGHLAMLATGGIPLALAMISRGHGWSLRQRDQPRKVGWAVAGWLVAVWQVSLGLDLGLPFGYILLVTMLVAAIRWLVRLVSRRRPPVSGFLPAIDIIGLASCATVLVWLTRMVQVTAAGSAEDLARNSPPLRGFITAPVQSLIWGGAHAPARAALTSATQMAVLPGFFLFAMASAGLVISNWRSYQRVLLLLGALASGLLAMGTAGPAHGRFGYVPVARWLPGLDEVRAPNALTLWTTLLLAVLAAGAVDALAGQVAPVADRLDGTRGRTLARRTLRLAVFLPLILVVAEGLPAYDTPAAHHLRPQTSAASPLGGMSLATNGASGTPSKSPPSGSSR